MAKTLNAGAELPKILRAWAYAGYPGFNDQSTRAVRVILHALTHILPHRSAQGVTTVQQIADVCGYSLKWTRRTMLGMEAAGLISYRPGGVVAGVPAPGFLRVNKSALLAATKAARAAWNDHLEARRQQTRARVAHLKNTRPRPRGTGHMELKTRLLTSNKVEAPRPPALDDREALNDREYVAAQAAMTAVRATWRHIRKRQNL